MTRREALLGVVAGSLTPLSSTGGQGCLAGIPGSSSGAKPDTAVRSMEIGAVSAPQARFDKVDPDLLMRTAKDAGIECVMLYSMEHWGYALYDTKIGYKHPNLNYDLLGAQVEAARKYGLSPLCYYSFNFAQKVMEEHPDWRMLDEEGNPWKYGKRWYYACTNSPYGSFLLDTLDEIFGKYKLDGLFLDIFPAKPCFTSTGSDPNPFCYCPYCLKLWEQETGTSFRGGVHDPEGRRKRVEWVRLKMGDEEADKMRAAITRHVPHATLSGNGGCLFYWKSLIDKLDYNYGEPEFSRSGVCLGGALMRGWGKPRYQQGVWMRDQRTIADRASVSVMQAEAASEIVQGSRVFAVGSLILGQFPNGFDQNTVRSAARAFEGSNIEQCLTENVEALPCIGVVSGEDSFNEATANGDAPAVRKSVFGALETFTRSHYPVTSIPDWKLAQGKLEGYRILVLPETEVLSESHIDVVRRFVSSGGLLIATGRCGLKDERGNARSDFPLADVLGVNYEGEETGFVENVSKTGGIYRGASVFFMPSHHPLAAIAGGEPVGAAGPFLHIKGSAEDIFHLGVPMFAESVKDGLFFHWFPPPMETPATRKGITLNRYGNGSAIYVPCNLFEQFYGVPAEWISAWIGSLVTNLLPHPPITLRGGAPEGVHHETYWIDRATNRAIVLIANTSARFYNAELVAVRGARIVASATDLPVRSGRVIWPNPQPLRPSRRGATWEADLPDLGTLTAIEINLQPPTKA